MAKHDLRNRAIELRKSGLTYSEILKQIPVAKSTLSLWLQSVGLSKKQKQRITEKRLASAMRGGKAKHLQRLALVEQINGESAVEVGKISRRELWLMGIMLYWAEGSEEKENKPGSGMRFANSDPYMIQVFLDWLLLVVGVKRERINFEIYIHETKKNNIPRVVGAWSSYTGFPKEKFTRIYFKKNKINTKRKNIGDLYFGVLRVKVMSSSGLHRRINGWVYAVSKRNWGVV